MPLYQISQNPLFSYPSWLSLSLSLSISLSISICLSFLHHVFLQQAPPSFCCGPLQFPRRTDRGRQRPRDLPGRRVGESSREAVMYTHTHTHRLTTRPGLGQGLPLAPYVCPHSIAITRCEGNVGWEWMCASLLAATLPGVSPHAISSLLHMLFLPCCVCVCVYSIYSCMHTPYCVYTPLLCVYKEVQKHLFEVLSSCLSMVLKQRRRCPRCWSRIRQEMPDDFRYDTPALLKVKGLIWFMIDVLCMSNCFIE